MSSTPTSATVRCRKCGRALRSPEAIALGFGTACAKALGVGRWAPGARASRRAARRIVKRMAPEVDGQGALFPEHDRTLVESALEEAKK